MEETTGNDVFSEKAENVLHNYISFFDQDGKTRNR